MTHTNTPMQTLRQDLTSALNRHSAEHNSNTPDFILAEYLIDCLAAYDRATAARHRHHHGVNETMEMVFGESQLPGIPPYGKVGTTVSDTPTTAEPDLPPIGATLRFTQDHFQGWAPAKKGLMIEVKSHHEENHSFNTSRPDSEDRFFCFYSDWREGLEIVKLPEA